MKITRMLEGGGSSAARDLLESARVDEPPRSAFARTAASIGVAGAGMALSSAVHGATASGAIASTAKAGVISTMVIAKWVLIGAVTGGAFVTTAVFVATPPRNPAPAVVQAPRPIANDPPPAPAPPAKAPPLPEPLTESPPAVQRTAEPRALESAPSQEPRTLIPPALPPPSSIPTSPLDQGSLLRDEVAMIDAARAALGSHDSSTALSILNRYDARVRTHVLDREARLLRIDALVQSGDRAMAARLAQAYLNDFRTTRTPRVCEPSRRALAEPRREGSILPHRDMIALR